MNVAIIGSTSYIERMKEHGEQLKAEGHSVAIPAFDSHPEFNELGICAYNQAMIASADIVHVIWDGRSTGTIFDLGMAFALGKPVKVIYLNTKTFTNLLKQYEELSSYITQSVEDDKEMDDTVLEKFGKVGTPAND